jgi:hypothetical protein
MALPEVLYRAAFDHPLLYHNRLTAVEVEARFASASFVKVASRRFIWPQYHYVVSDEEVMEGERGVRWRVPGTPSWRLGAQEVRTAATHLLYRKLG